MEEKIKSILEKYQLELARKNGMPINAIEYHYYGDIVEEIIREVHQGWKAEKESLLRHVKLEIIEDSDTLDDARMMIDTLIKYLE